MAAEPLLIERVAGLETAMRDLGRLPSGVMEQREQIVSLRERVAAIESTGRQLQDALGVLSESVISLTASVETLVTETRDIVNLSKGTKAWAEVGKFTLAVGATAVTVVAGGLGILERLGFLRF